MKYPHKCPSCDRPHVRARGSHDDVICACGLRLRWVVPVFHPGGDGWKLAAIRDVPPPKEHCPACNGEMRGGVCEPCFEAVGFGPGGGYT